jgi:hypothetical protein
MSLSPALQAQAFAAVRPLLAQVQCVGLDADTHPVDQWGRNCITALRTALQQDVTQLCLWLRAPDLSYMSKWSTWVFLVNALPHVKVIQLAIQGLESFKSLWRFLMLMGSAVNACERSGR